MKISLNWLKDYIDIKKSPCGERSRTAEEIADILSDLGLPCEGIEYPDGDAVIDVEVTSNRGDCLGYIGIARELAAATDSELKMPAVELDESGRDVTEFAAVQIDEPDLCGRYTARIIEGVKVGPSPDWLKKRLETAGMRSVNNVVDATNYAMMETGQPPHAFDYKKIAGGKIIVRKAATDETMVSIDGSKCELAPDMLIIADAVGPVAIAGVMGGLDTEVGENTTTILLEDAYFKPASVHTTARRLSLPSEAAFRFERTVDIEAIDHASKRTAQLIIQAAGGRAVRGVIDIYPGRQLRKKATLRLDRLKKLLGIDVPSEKAVQILSRLGFQPEIKNGSIFCSIPSWRSDVYREADLIEEVVRVYGYDKIPTGQKIRIEVVPVDARHKLTESIKTYLNGCGFYETVNVSFIDNSVAGLFTPLDGGGHLSVKDVSRKGTNLLRRTLLGSLLGVLKANLNVKNTPCRIFEIADTFIPTDKQTGGLPIEKTRLALVCDGDLRDLRGAVDGLVKSINKNTETVFKPADITWAEVGAEITVDGKVIGSAGIVGKSVREKFDFKDISPVCAELEFEMLSALQAGSMDVKPLPRFPAIVRDLSIVVDEQVVWSDVVAAVNKKAATELEDVRFVGIYHGKGIPAGKKSVTLSLRFRDEDGTLIHEAVDGFEKAIIAGLAECTGAELRTV